jgi:tetratricopeptide (TPR) repeat protein
LLLPLAESGQIDGHALLGLGLAELELGELELALQHLEDAEPRLLRPEARVLAQLSLGRVYSALGRHDAALRRLEPLELDQLGEDALAAYAKSMLATGQSELLRQRLEARLAAGGAANASLLRTTLDQLRRS